MSHGFGCVIGWCKYKLGNLHLYWFPGKLQCIIRAPNWWEFLLFIEGHWQSPCTALTAGICLPWGLCKETERVYIEVKLQGEIFKAYLPTITYPPIRDCHGRCFNSLTSERCGCNLRCVRFKYASATDILSISCEISLKWIPQDQIADKSISVQVMAWFW